MEGERGDRVGGGKVGAGGGGEGRREVDREGEGRGVSDHRK